MILCLRTDSPDTELYLVSDGKQIATHAWRADRSLAKDLLRQIDTLLSGASVQWSDISGLIVFRGPGSFTGLRIGCTVMNTLAYAHGLPIVGTTGDNWLKDGVTSHANGIDLKSVMPEYGAEPRITTPRK